jgi:hypothetical protein
MTFSFWQGLGNSRIEENVQGDYRGNFEDFVPVFHLKGVVPVDRG